MHLIDLVIIFRVMLPKCTNKDYYVNDIEDKEW